MSAPHKILILGIFMVSINNIDCQTVPESEATIVEYKNVPYEFDEVKKEGSYEFSYFTYNATRREEKGTFVDNGNGQGEMVVIGSYSYPHPDENKRIIVEYVADSQGYRAKTREEETYSGLGGIPAALLGSLAGGGIG